MTLALLQVFKAAWSLWWECEVLAEAESEGEWVFVILAPNPTKNSVQDKHYAANVLCAPHGWSTGLKSGTLAAHWLSYF